MLNQVFISYRHEGPQHAREVRRLGELLRQAGLPVALDQFHLDEHPGGPDAGGWPQWSEDNANKSDCVLIVASPGWAAAYDGTAPPGTGLGVATEAHLFRQELWDEQNHNARIRVVLLDADADASAVASVPRRLRAWHRFRPFDSDDELSQLIRWAARRLGRDDAVPPTVRWPDPADAFKPDLADRTAEWPAVVALLAGRSRERILLFQGESGLGKSALIRQSAAYAAHVGVPVVRVDFKGGIPDVAGVLGQFELDLGEHLPHFSREGGTRTHLLRKDLRALRQPVLVIFDSYDAHVAGNAVLADWLSQHLLAEVETSRALAVIVAGQQAPDLARAGWRDLARHLPLAPITDPAAWEPWIAQRYPSFRDKAADLRTVLLLSGGNPAVVYSACEAIAAARPAP